jgi:hypothetical protein
LISSVKATLGEHSTICANIQIIRNSANYTFWLSIFSFLLDKFDTGFELGVTTPLKVRSPQMDLGGPETLEAARTNSSHIERFFTSLLPQGVEQMSSQVAH